MDNVTELVRSLDAGQRVAVKVDAGREQTVVSALLAHYAGGRVDERQPDAGDWARLAHAAHVVGDLGLCLINNDDELAGEGYDRVFVWT